MTRLLLALAALMVTAAPAVGATVTYSPGTVEPPDTAPEESCSRYMQCTPPSVTVRGEPGEANVLSVTLEGTELVVRDAGAPLTTSGGCRRHDDGAVRCPGVQSATVEAGDGADRVVLEVFGSVHGGEGDDDLRGGLLYGGPGDDVLTGTAIIDRLEGGPGADRVVAGAGDDVVVDEPSAFAPDLLDGGEGLDVLDFTERSAAVVADTTPGAQSAGSSGEGNVVSGFETLNTGAGDDVLRLASTAMSGSAWGVTARTGRGDDDVTVAAALAGLVDLGAGDDRLAGSPFRDRVDGGPGDDVIAAGGGRDEIGGGRGADRLDGGAGNDRLTGGPGSDRLAGGTGADRILAREAVPRADRVDCGANRDTAVTDRRDRPRRCERVHRAR